MGGESSHGSGRRWRAGSGTPCDRWCSVGASKPLTPPMHAPMLQVRFHPLDSDLFASGSLDHRVVVWRISTGEKIFMHDFGAPQTIRALDINCTEHALFVSAVDSWAFASYRQAHRVHRLPPLRKGLGRRVWSQGVSQRKLPHQAIRELTSLVPQQVYFWDYSKPSSSTRPHQNPSYILRTKRSLRALHFHPLGLPLILTAEVVDNKRGGAAVPVLADGAQVAEAAPPEVAAVAAVAALAAATVIPVAPVITTPPASPHAAAAAPTPSAAAPDEADTQNLPGRSLSLSGVARRVLDMAGIRLPGMGSPMQAMARAIRAAGGSSGGSNSSATAAAVATEENLRLQGDLGRLGITDAYVAAAAGGRLRGITVPGGAGPSQQPAAPAAAGPTAPAAAAAPTLPPNIAAAAAAQGQIAAVTSAAMSAMERLGSGAIAGTSSSHTPQAAAASTAPFVDLAMCDPWGMQRIRTAVGTQTHAFPLEPQLLGPTYDLSWGWDASGNDSSRAATPPPVRQNAMLESQLMPLAMVSEQPCVVNLNVWSFNHRRPTSVLDKARISVPRAVLCSEMGAQFSPCGRYLAVCVAVEGELSEPAQQWLRDQITANGARMRQAESVRDAAMLRFRSSTAPAASSSSPSSSSSKPAPPPGPSRLSRDARPSDDGLGSSSHQLSEPLTRIELGDGFMVPVSQAWEVFPNDVQWLEFGAGTAQEVIDDAVHAAREGAGLNKPMYELRIYSLEGGTFGQVLQSRLIRAAHCLTSLQFSPTSEHLLVAYGRRFISLCNLIAEGRSLVPAHTVLEVYR